MSRYRSALLMSILAWQHTQHHGDMVYAFTCSGSRIHRAMISLGKQVSEREIKEGDLIMLKITRNLMGSGLLWSRPSFLAT